MATITTHFQIGLQDMHIDAVGGDFSSPTDNGPISEDGVNVAAEINNEEIADAHDIGLYDIYENAHTLVVTGAWIEHSVNAMALSFGRAMAEVVDDNVGPPPTLTIGAGSWAAKSKYALRLRALRPDSTTLYDMFTMKKGVFVFAWENAMSYRSGARMIPFEYRTLKVTNGASQWDFVSEGVVT